jgi:hypothetical protein
MQTVLSEPLLAKYPLRRIAKNETLPWLLCNVADD